MPRVTERYDTADQFDWSYIRTTYSKGKIAETYTLYDDRSEGVQAYSRDNLVSEIRTDNPQDGSTNPWSEIHTTYDANGAPATVHTIYDDGTTQDDQFSNGVLVSSTLNDDPAVNAYDWQHIERSYDSAGVLQQQITTYDSGTVLNETFVNGTLSSSIHTDDPAVNAENWERIERTYDSSGQVQQKVIFFDNGVVDDIQYTDGTISFRVQYDDPYTNAEEWERIESTYDGNGQLQQEVIFYDNGVVDDSQYTQGTISFRVQHDDPYTSAEEWERIESTYDGNGQLQQEVIFYDNGVVDDSQYTDGTISFRVQYDDPYTNAKDWDRIESFYDPEGQLAQQVIIYDSGVVDDTQYTNGTIAFRVQYDDPYTNAEAWERIDSFYDQNGQLTQQVIVNDNGIVDDTQYTDGTIAFRIQYDDPYTNAEEWERIDSFYDQDGQLAQQVIVNDNGTVDDTQYTNGTIAFRVQTDDPYTNAEDWERIDSFYDQNGQLAQQVTVYDTGVVDDMQFYNGLATYRFQNDDPYSNAEDWEWIETFYDGSGRKSFEMTFFDDGVENQKIYENGQLVSETSLDSPEGPNLYDWTGQITEYAPDGQIELSATLYDNGDYMRDDFAADGTLAIHWDYDGDGDMTWLGRRIDYAPDGTELETSYWYEGDVLPPEIDPEYGGVSVMY